MALTITTFQAQDGKVFASEIEADAHDIAVSRKAEIDAFVAIHFPKKEGSTKGNPHASTAAKAIALYSAYTAGAASGVEGETQGELALS